MIDIILEIILIIMSFIIIIFAYKGIKQHKNEIVADIKMLNKDNAINFAKEMNNMQNNMSNIFEEKIDRMTKNIDNKISNFTTENEQKMNNIRDIIGKLQEENTKKLDEIRNVVDESLNNRLNNSFKNVKEGIENTQNRFNEIQNNKLSDLISQTTSNYKKSEETLGIMVKNVENRISNFSTENEQKLENIRNTIKESLNNLQNENTKKLEEMRATVDEKLQRTLEERLGQSFKLVSERLEQVHKGLGEMQTLASGVGDLKKVLSNVKTRGILGEIQLGAILEQILSQEQYEMNVATVKGSRNVVEFAIKLPAGDDTNIFLPIDAKFPADTYSKLVEAYETGNQEEINMATKTLESVIKSFAKDIKTKYIEPPYTTDFAIMFLPFEGLYAEVVRRGLLEIIQREYKVTIAGPTTMAALLNSLQMGFKTLAVQKHSSEVWGILGAVKTEFEKFGGILEKTQKKINEANTTLDELIGKRTRQINRKLKNIESIPEEKSIKMLDVSVDE